MKNNYKQIELIDEESLHPHSKSREFDSKSEAETADISHKPSLRSLDDLYFHDHPELDASANLGPQTFPSIPLQPVLLTIFLTITGIGFVIAFILNVMNGGGAEKILTYMLFGFILLTPGCYYGLHLYQAYTADSPEEREEMLNEIPM